MSSTFFGLNIGSTGLYAYKSALNVTAHNIANAERDGYSRQVLNYKASRALKVNASYGMVGTGVNVTGIEQIRNEYFDNKYWLNSTVKGEYEAKSDYMNQIQTYFNEIKLEGFTKTFNSMFASIDDLTRNPSSLVTRTQVTNFASGLTEYFNFMSTSMQSIQEQCNFEIKNQVDRINSYSQQIAHLNKQINTIEATGLRANDLRDERALLVDKLSAIADVSVKETVVGEKEVGVNLYVVKINNQTLVDGVDFNTLRTVQRKEKVNQNDIDGLFDIEWVNSGSAFEPVSPIQSGTLKALFEVRDGNDSENLKGKVSGNKGDTFITVTDTNPRIDSVDKMNFPDSGIIKIGSIEYEYEGYSINKVGDKYEYTLKEPLKADVANVKAEIGKSISYKGIPYYMGQLNQFIRTFAKAYNDIHKDGQDLYGNKGQDFFTGVKIDSKDIIFNSDEDYRNLTAANFSVNEDIMKDPSLIVTAKNMTEGMENNEIVLMLLKLRDDVGMFKQGTPSSFLQTMVAEVGIDTKKAENFAKSQENIVNSIENQRLSVSGVDSDEEAINLIRFQNAYNLSAKVISVMDEIYDKLINYMGV